MSGSLGAIESLRSSILCLLALLRFFEMRVVSRHYVMRSWVIEELGYIVKVA